jgi:hypothetical protein
MAVTPTLFAEALLGRLGVPVSPNNVAAIVAFEAWEAGHMNNTARFNPMNTHRDMPGATQAPGLLAGTRAYASWDDGVEATARTLEQSNMSGILDALRRSAPADETLRAIASSPWGCVICAKSPAVMLQWYANKAFPDGGAIMDMGFGVERFARDHSKLIIGAFVVGGLGLLAIGIARARRPRVLRSA